MSLLAGLAPAERKLARRAGTPQWAEPMLATLTSDRFSDAAWIFERKLDGERVVALRTDGRVRLCSRTGHDLGSAYPEVAGALSAQPGGDLMADGEVVAFEGQVTSFARLQPRMQVTDARQARASGVAVYYYLFDLLYADGHDLADLPLRRRKALLRAAVGFAGPLRFTAHRNGSGEEFYAQACAKGWEGLIAKRAASPYRHGRSRDWLKFKCVARQELVIGGWTDPRGSRAGLGALLAGYYDGPDLVYAGKVGTGFDESALHRLHEELSRREREAPPFAQTADLPRHGAHWAAPELVCETAFTEWTPDGRLRHPRYLGLRDDKNPREVTREVTP